MNLGNICNPKPHYMREITRGMRSDFAEKEKVNFKRPAEVTLDKSEQIQPAGPQKCSESKGDNLPEGQEGKTQTTRGKEILGTHPLILFSLAQ